MARIRTIKPEFWADEKLSCLEPLSRLVFIGLICMADDAGRLVDNVKFLDGQLFPNTDDSCGAALEILARLGRIVRYRSASGQQLIQVSMWRKHQKVDNPAKYTLPGPESTQPADSAADAPGVDPISRDAIEEQSRVSRSDLRPTTYDQGSTTYDQRAGATTNKDLDQEGRDALSADDLLREPDVVAFVARHYPRGQTSPARRRDVVNQLLASLEAGARFKRSRVHAHSIGRLAAKCREVLREGMKDPDKAIVVLLAKLADTSDLSKVRQQQESAARIEEHRDTARDLESAEAWLVDRPDVEAAISAQLQAEGLADVTDTGDEDKRKIAGAALRMTRNWLVLAAWRADGAPELVEKS